jgi:hypothetical protein
MNEETLFFAGLAAAFGLMLRLEWRYRFKSMRVGVALLALAILLFFQPPYHAAWRRAISTPPAERATRWSTINPDSGALLTEYQSGVFTMRRAVFEVKRTYERERWLMVGVLVWLACSPAFQGPRRRLPERSSSASSADVAPEA